jgi:hypothetical protein
MSLAQSQKEMPVSGTDPVSWGSAFGEQVPEDQGLGSEPTMDKT